MSFPESQLYKRQEIDKEMSTYDSLRSSPCRTGQQQKFIWWKLGKLLKIPTLDLLNRDTNQCTT